MRELVRTVNAIRSVPHCELHSLIKTVAVILCSPRSGSSLVKHALEVHPAIASLTGEIEPFLILTENGFGHNSNSDAIGNLKNKQALIDNIFDDLTVQSNTSLDASFLANTWEKRFLVQFPAEFSSDASRENLKYILHQLLNNNNNNINNINNINNNNPHQEYDSLKKTILSAVFKNEPWKSNYYDAWPTSDPIRWFNEPLKIEEPPFVVPRNGRRPFTEDDAKNKVLLFKTPPDVYRVGMYEALFPNADIKYIHLTRGYAQTVNGLLDGWLSPVGFFSHDLRRAGLNLRIEGYSDRVPFGKWWWKFDLPPNWRDFLEAKLEDVCLNQWSSAHKAVFDSGVKTLQLSFEDFLAAPDMAIRKIEKYLGLPEMDIPKNLPVMMATEVPKQKRWNKRNDLILSLGESEQVGKMMTLLGYEMNSETWL